MRIGTAGFPLAYVPAVGRDQIKVCFVQERRAPGGAFAAKPDGADPVCDLDIQRMPLPHRAQAAVAIGTGTALADVNGNQFAGPGADLYDALAGHAVPPSVTAAMAWVDVASMTGMVAVASRWSWASESEVNAVNAASWAVVSSPTPA